MPGYSAYAAAPFDHEKADIILRSSDKVDFRVFKPFLSLASPFFEALFNTPQPAEVNRDQEVRDGLAVISVTEDKKTLDTLLRFCYPCTLAEDPKLELLKNLVNVLEAARKYSLGAIERKVLQTLSNPQILEAEPLRCFAIARQGRAREETLLAARYTLSQPLIPSWFQEINLISAADLLALLTYHKKCGEAVYALKTDKSWIESHYGKKSSSGCPWFSREGQSHECGVSGVMGQSRSAFSNVVTAVPKWWLDFSNEIYEALLEKPCRATIESCAAKTVQSVRAGGCPSCSVSISVDMLEFSELLRKKVDRVISKVQLALVF